MKPEYSVWRRDFVRPMNRHPAWTYEEYRTFLAPFLDLVGQVARTSLAITTFLNPPAHVGVALEKVALPFVYNPTDSNVHVKADFIGVGMALGSYTSVEVAADGVHEGGFLSAAQKKDHCSSARCYNAVYRMLTSEQKMLFRDFARQMCGLLERYSQKYFWISVEARNAFQISYYPAVKTAFSEERSTEVVTPPVRLVVTNIPALPLPPHPRVEMLRELAAAAAATDPNNTVPAAPAPAPALVPTLATPVPVAVVAAAATTSPLPPPTAAELQAEDDEWDARMRSRPTSIEPPDVSDECNLRLRGSQSPPPTLATSQAENNAGDAQSLSPPSAFATPQAENNTEETSVRPALLLSTREVPSKHPRKPATDSPFDVPAVESPLRSLPKLCDYMVPRPSATEAPEPMDVVLISATSEKECCIKRKRPREETDEKAAGQERPRKRPCYGGAAPYFEALVATEVSQYLGHISKETTKLHTQWMQLANQGKIGEEDYAMYDHWAEMVKQLTICCFDAQHQYRLPTRLEVALIGEQNIMKFEKRYEDEHGPK